MKVRAAIFDVYGTLLELGLPPADREERWRRLWSETFGSPQRLDLREFEHAVSVEVGRRHARARHEGIPFPEVYWPEVVESAVPELARTEPASAERWRREQVRLQHSVRLMAGVSETLAALRAGGVLLGIASNAQPYTLTELDEALAGFGLGMDLFEPDLVFWSFAHGFSKPDPHVFRLLGARLAARRIEPSDTLMVGDRLDNDVRPARAAGWNAWHLAPDADEGGGDGAEAGDWAALAAASGFGAARAQ